MLLDAAVITLLQHCDGVLQEATEVLYEVLFTLAQDEWPQVSSLCQNWLSCWLPLHQDSLRVRVGPDSPISVACMQLRSVIPRCEHARLSHAELLVYAQQVETSDDGSGGSLLPCRRHNITCACAS